MVNAHGKYPDGAANKAAYTTDGSDVRDATAEEMIRYREANKHRRKKVDEKSTSSEPSLSSTVLLTGAPPQARPASVRAERGAGNASSGDRSEGNRVMDKERDSSRKRGENAITQKSDDRESTRAQESREPEQNRTASTLYGKPDEAEADRREMAKIQGRIEARKAAKDLEVARATIKELKSSRGGAPLAPPKPSRRATERDKGEGEKKTGTTRGTKKALATQTISEVVIAETASLDNATLSPPVPELVATEEVPVSLEPTRGRLNMRTTVERHGDDALSTLKFGAIGETCAHPTSSTDDMSSAELGIALVASALGKKVPRKSSD